MTAGTVRRVYFRARESLVNPSRCGLVQPEALRQAENVAIVCESCDPRHVGTRSPPAWIVMPPRLVNPIALRTVLTTHTRAKCRAFFRTLTCVRCRNKLPRFRSSSLTKSVISCREFHSFPCTHLVIEMGRFKRKRCLRTRGYIDLTRTKAFPVKMYTNEIRQ